MYRFLFIFIITLHVPIIAFGKSIDERIMEIYQSHGSAAHVNKASAFKGQQAGYVTGGGVSISNSSYNKLPLKVSLPTVNAGCGGIDIFAGSLSFVDAKELESALKNIVSSASGYAFLLAMDTISPQMSNITSQLQSWANNINGININSCEFAQGLVSSVWPKNEMASRRVCQLYASGNAYFRDHNMTRNGCSDESKKTPIINEQKKDNVYKFELFDDYNIVWEAINRKNIKLGKFDKYSVNDAMKIMSLTGSLIVRKINNKPEVFFLESKVGDDQFINALMRGGQANIYVMKESDPKCLYPESRSVNIPDTDSWCKYVENRMMSIVETIQEDNFFSDEDKLFIEECRLPIYKALNIMAAYRQGACPLEMTKLSEYVSGELFANRVIEIIALVRSGCEILKTDQQGGGAEIINAYLHQLAIVENEVMRMSKKFRMSWQEELAYLERMDMLEEEIRSRIRFD